MLRAGVILGGLCAVLVHAQVTAPVCAKCHPSETAKFLASPMGRSIGPPEVIASGAVAHAPSGSRLAASYRNGRLVHTLSERGLDAEYPVALQIGRGMRARSYAVRIGEYLLESPLSWYKSAGWDVSPGYESMQLLDFDRPVTENCLFCHADRARATDADGRRIPADAVSAIGCGRCHGDSKEHVVHPSAKNIVNPARLTGAARDGVCEQCHLEGETRVNNPGKTQWDYRPGEPLEASIVTYLFKDRNPGARKAVTQVEELAESKCAMASGGKLWCGSCHNPHGDIDVNQVCAGCHAQVSTAAHPPNTMQCVTCHMKARPTSNVAHLAVTDHQLRKPDAPIAAMSSGSPLITPWRQPAQDFRLRNLALAGLLIAAEQQLPALATQSTALLEKLPAKQQSSDPDVLAALEALFLGTSAPEKAVELSQWAVQSVPQSATFALNHGLALMKAGNLPEAERELLRAGALDPSLMQAAAQLAILYDRQGKQAESRAAIDRFLRWNPQSIQFRYARTVPK